MLSSFVGKGYQLLVGLGSQAVKEGFPYVLSAMGQETFEVQIQKKLSEIVENLKTIKSSIAAMNRKVNTLLSDLNLSTDHLTNEIAQSSIAPSISIINNQYNNLLLLNPDDDAGVRKFVTSLDTKHDIDQDIFFISDFMGSSIKTGALDAFADLLGNDIINAKDKGTALIQSYHALEGYFRRFLAVQMKGVFLEMNIQNYQDYDTGKSGSEQQYFSQKIIPMLAGQADDFLMAVERLVVKAADVRTLMFDNYSMFPREAVELIFSKADFPRSKHSFWEWTFGKGSLR